MPIVGLAFTSFVANKKAVRVKGEIKVNSTPKIVSIKEVTVPTMQKKGLAVSFEFVSTYAPDLAEIKISGEILYLAKSNAAILKGWKKNKKLPEDMTMEILNHLFRRCLLKIAYMADELQLPPPLGMPTLNPKDAKPGYVG
ncbi:MAG: hypothetical protein KKC05_04015 [Nanoarchaeota archaeon]|nr:hypothetical protein [Nanoarchaeota archaeon]